MIHVATDGLDAVASATEYQPDVVLMDVSMPGMNGLEATRRIKQCDPDAAVVILSGHDDEYMLARAVQAGAVGLLRKTQAVGDVASTVRRAHRGEAITTKARSSGRSDGSATGGTSTATFGDAWNDSRLASSRSSRRWRRAASPRRSRRSSG